MNKKGTLMFKYCYRSEIQHLTTLLHSRTTESPDNVVDINGAKPHSSPSPLLRLEASTSGSMKKHGDNRDNFHATISTPFVSSKVSNIFMLVSFFVCDFYL